MKKMSLGILFLILIFINCGRNPSNVDSESDANLIKYRLTAVVDMVAIPDSINFKPSLGDTLSGEFSYSLNTQDHNIWDTNQGFYFPIKPSQVNLSINSFNFNSNYNYNILIQRNDSSALPIRDILSLSAADSNVANELNLLEVQVVISFLNFNSIRFPNDSLPCILDLNEFDGHEMHLNIQDKSGNHYNVRLNIIELAKR